MHIKLYPLILSLLICFGIADMNIVQAQAVNQTELQLAQQYYRNGEYEKAQAIYEKLYLANKNSEYYYRNLLNSIMAQKNLDVAQTLIEDQIKNNKKNPGYYVDLGNIYSEKEDSVKAKEMFDKALNNMGKDIQKIRSVASTFQKIEQYDYAISTYEHGREVSAQPQLFLYEMANLYNAKGDLENTLHYYLDYAQYNPKNTQLVKNFFQRNLKDDERLEVLQAQLYKRIQGQPEETMFPELLIWLFTQQRDFESALIQARALDKRFQEDGKRVFNLGLSASGEKQYDAAIEAFTYLIDKGATSSMYVPAKSQLLKTRQLKVTDTNDYTQNDLLSLEQEYLDFISTSGRNSRTAETMRELSRLYAYYLNDIPKAIPLMEEVVNISGTSAIFKGESKVDLADFMLMSGDVWEATLVYSQVDKAHKEDLLGERARYKNAELSYFLGDFEWAQTQLNILKASTSELIANDALDLSVFITDNWGLDTTNVTMAMYARSELLLRQNRQAEVLATLDSINTIYPGHSLDDDILKVKAEMAIKNRDYNEAVAYYEQILEDYLDDLLADDATFMLGEINEKYLDQPKTAMDFYQSVILDFNGSLWTVEARKRFRRLRGDMFN